MQMGIAMNTFCGLSKMFRILTEIDEHRFTFSWTLDVERTQTNQKRTPVLSTSEVYLELQTIESKIQYKCYWIVNDLPGIIIKASICHIFDGYSVAACCLVFLMLFSQSTVFFFLRSVSLYALSTSISLSYSHSLTHSRVHKHTHFGRSSEK